jgi:hypothetical protein
MTDPNEWPEEAREVVRRCIRWATRDYTEAQITDVFTALAPFLAARVADARRNALRDAARIARMVIMEWQHYEDATDADALAKDAAAAILARAEGEP